MLNVKNSLAVRRIAHRSFAANRTRNAIAVTAIALTAILFTTLFTLGAGAINAFQWATMRQTGGYAHATLKYIDDRAYNSIKGHPLIKEISYNRLITTSIDSPELQKRPAEMWYMDSVGMKLGFCTPTIGMAPQAADEIALDTKTLDLLAVPHELGAAVPLSYTIRGQQLLTVFKLAGYWESDPAFNVGLMLLSNSFVEEHVELLINSFRTDQNLTGTVNSQIMFRSSFGISSKLNRVVTESGWSLDSEAENYIETGINWAYLSTNFTDEPVALLGMASAVLLIMLVGYLIIYNIFQISVLRDIRFYGLLKTIGTTGRQIRRIIRYQAVVLSLVGIPIGLTVGWFLGRALVPLLLSVTAYRGGEVMVATPLIFIFATLFSLVTVVISTGRPGRIAAHVAPVEAARYSDQAVGVRRQAKRSTDGGKLPRMALSNLGRNRRRTLLVIASLCLSLVLLNTVFTFSRGIDLEKYLRKFMNTDYLIAHSEYFQFRYHGSGEAASAALISAVQTRPEFSQGGCIYFSHATMPSVLDADASQTDVLGNTAPLAVDGNPLLWLYGVDELPLSRFELLQGELDRTKLATGRYLIEGVQVDDHSNPWWGSSHFAVGETVILNLNGETRQYELLAKVKVPYYPASARTYSEYTMYLPKEAYLQLVDEPAVMSYVFDVHPGSEPTMDAFLRHYTDSPEQAMQYESRQVMVEQFRDMHNLILTVGGVLSLVIGVIGLLNFANAMLTSIVTRRREFAMLQSIGMTSGQLSWMLRLEGLYYALATIGGSFALSCLFSQVVIRSLAGNLWFFSYRLTIWPLLATYPVLLGLAVAIPFVTHGLTVQETVVERLRHAE